MPSLRFCATATIALATVSASTGRYLDNKPPSTLSSPLPIILAIDSPALDSGLSPSKIEGWKM